MTNTNRKLKRIRVLEQVRQSKMDKESVELATIRAQKAAKAQELKNSQRDYLAGIEQLNQLRSSQSRDNLEFMEVNLDYLKAKWMRLFSELQAIERAEKVQIENLSLAHRDLKSVGNLAQKLEQTARHELAKSEQKVQDEQTITRSWHNNSRNQSN